MPSDKRVLVGCVRQYCYCRERKYCPFDDVADFGYIIKVRENAPDLLYRTLARAPVGILFAGDDQAAEHKLEVSQRMLEIRLDPDSPYDDPHDRTHLLNA